MAKVIPFQPFKPVIYSWTCKHCSRPILISKSAFEHLERRRESFVVCSTCRNQPPPSPEAGMVAA